MQDQSTCNEENGKSGVGPVSSVDSGRRVRTELGGGQVMHFALKSLLRDGKLAIPGVGTLFVLRSGLGYSRGKTAVNFVPSEELCNALKADSGNNYDGKERSTRLSPRQDGKESI